MIMPIRLNLWVMTYTTTLLDDDCWINNMWKFHCSHSCKTNSQNIEALTQKF